MSRVIFSQSQRDWSKLWDNLFNYAGDSILEKMLTWFGEVHLQGSYGMDISACMANSTIWEPAASDALLDAELPVVPDNSQCST